MQGHTVLLQDIRTVIKKKKKKRERERKKKDNDRFTIFDRGEQYAH